MGEPEAVNQKRIQSPKSNEARSHRARRAAGASSCAGRHDETPRSRQRSPDAAAGDGGLDNEIETVKCSPKSPQGPPGGEAIDQQSGVTQGQKAGSIFKPATKFR